MARNKPSARTEFRFRRSGDVAKAIVAAESFELSRQLPQRKMTICQATPILSLAYRTLIILRSVLPSNT
jgi:hypothetical protein